MKKILIVGAGFGQVPAIKKSKELGYKVVAVDRNPNALGMAQADIPLVIDTADVTSIVQAAKKHKVDGAMTMQSDLPVPAIGAVNDALGLAGVTEEIARICSNKYLTRKRLAKSGVPQPRFFACESAEEAKSYCRKIGFPCVVKAPDSSGSRGITKVNSTAEVEQAFAQALEHSRGKKVIVEEYIEGLEFGAQTFSVRGECARVLLHNDTVSRPPYMIPVGHSFPFEIRGVRARKIEEACGKAVEALGIVDGPANLDLILSKDNEPKLIEVGARIGATCLPELVEYYSGIDWVKAAILSCVGLKPVLEEKFTKPVAAVILESPKDGALKHYRIPDEVRSDPDVLEVEITAEIGEDVNILRKGTDRIGKVVARGKSAAEAEQKAENIKKKITIEVEGKTPKK